MNILFFLTPKNEVEYVLNNCNVENALEVIEKSGYSSIPVLNEDGSFLGTLTEGDLLYTIKNNIDYNKFSVKDIMNRVSAKPISINAKIEDLLIKSLDQNFIPVIDDNNIFIGIVTRKNIIQYCYNRYVAVEKD